LKFDRDRYEALDKTERQIVEAVYFGCDTAAGAQGSAEGGNTEENTVIVTNPAAGPDDPKLFYGTISESDLQDANVACQTGLAYATIPVMILSGAGGSSTSEFVAGQIMTYADVACGSLASGLASDNITTLLAPTYMVNEAVTKQILSEIIEDVPLLSPEDARRVQELIAKANVVPVVRVADGSISVTTVGEEIKIGVATKGLPLPEVTVGNNDPIPVPTTPLGGTAIIVDKVLDLSD
jgi:hypothetical protein